jgi:hypothetical protein
MHARRRRTSRRPYVFIASIIIARAPLPLTGFMIAVGSAGVKSVLTPSCVKSQVKPLVMNPSTPELRSTLIATSIPTRYGMMTARSGCRPSRLR